MYWCVKLQFDKVLSIFLFLMTFSSVAGFCRLWFLYQTTQHHSFKSSGNDEDHKFATLLNIFFCCENFMSFSRNALGMYKVLNVDFARKQKIRLLTRIWAPGSKSGEKLTALTEVLCSLGATDEKAYKSNTSTTKHNLQTKLAPKEEILYRLPSMS